MKSIFKAFFGSMFGVLGAFVGLICIAIVFAVINIPGGKSEPSGHYEVLPNADASKEHLHRNTPLILTVNIKGVIGTDKLDTEGVAGQFQRSQEGAFKGRIKGVLLNVNTPGGSVFDSNSIYRLIKQYKARYDVPVYVYVDGLCASGGMYISCAADKIYASDVSLVGSVGIMANFVNVSGTLEKIGVKALVLTRGKDKAALNPLIPLKEGDDKNLQSILTYFYDDFVNVVTTNRPKISKEDLVDIYGAQTFPAPEAASYGYIDGVVESRDAVLEELVAAAEIEDYQVIQLEEKKWLDNIFSSLWSFNTPKGYLYLDEKSLPY